MNDSAITQRLKSPDFAQPRTGLTWAIKRLRAKMQLHSALTTVQKAKTRSQLEAAYNLHRSFNQTAELFGLISHHEATAYSRELAAAYFDQLVDVEAV